MDVTMKKAFSIILCLVLLFSLTSCGSIKRIEPFVWGFSNHNIDNYEKNRAKIEYTSDYMPDLNELDGYNAISYSYQYTNLVFFDSNSIALFVEYPKDLYEEKKNEVLASYDFLEATKISKDGECYQSAPAKFEYGGYDFCTYANLTVGYYTDCAYKSFGFIGTDDDKNRIAYCYFYDFDLDTFGSVNRSEQEMITDFINDFFDWNDLP
jgi:hypothetical protein